jgi:hypothetical protein
MIKPIEKVICKEIHNFVEEHIDEVEKSDERIKELL